MKLSSNISNRRSDRGSGASLRGLQKIFNSRLLLQIGLVASVSFHFTWVGKRLSSNSAQNAAYDALLIAPEYTQDGRDLYSLPTSRVASSLRRRFKLRSIRAENRYRRIHLPTLSFAFLSPPMQSTNDRRAWYSWRITSVLITSRTQQDAKYPICST